MTSFMQHCVAILQRHGLAESLVVCRGVNADAVALVSEDVSAVVATTVTQPASDRLHSRSLAA